MEAKGPGRRGAGLDHGSCNVSPVADDATARCLVPQYRNDGTHRSVFLDGYLQVDSVLCDGVRGTTRPVAVSQSF